MSRLAFVTGLLALSWNLPVMGQSSGGSSVLIIDGVQAGTLNRVTGGAISADVINEAGRNTFTKKHIGAVKYESFQMSFGLSMAPSLYDLLGDALRSGTSRFDGEVVAVDFNRTIKSEREFRSALITEIGFPAMDAASKETGLLSVTVKPSQIRSTAGSGKLPPNSDSRPRAWLSSNFRLELDGLDAGRVTRIEPFSMKRPVSEGIGQSRVFGGISGKWEFSNLKITLSEASAKTWQQWHEDFVIRGNNDDGEEKSGSLVFLSPDLKTELGRVNFSQCGIYRLAEAIAANGALLPGYVTAELYCEQMIPDFAVKR